MGSEMCIRDSPIGSPLPIHQAFNDVDINKPVARDILKFSADGETALCQQYIYSSTIIAPFLLKTFKMSHSLRFIALPLNISSHSLSPRHTQRQHSRRRALNMKLLVFYFGFLATLSLGWDVVCAEGKFNWPYS